LCSTDWRSGPMVGISPYKDSDAREVANLLCQVPELPDISEEGVRAFASQSRNQGGRDFLVVRVEDQVVAYVTSTLVDGDRPVRHARIAVHPDFRRHGLGTRLLHELLEQEAPPGTVLQGGIHASWTSARHFVEAKGFSVTPVDLLMRRGAQDVPVEVPRGVWLRRGRAGDDGRWIELEKHGFGHRDDFVPPTEQDLAISKSASGFALVVAEVERRVVGLCHGGVARSGEGAIYSVVVEEPHRGRRIGKALTATMLGRLRENGAEQVRLNVAVENERAISLYEGLGFHEHDRLWRCRLPADPSRPSPLEQ
ncbi:MAG: GNAT family N-acetyltransferase, partial [Polyangiales bacterium]